MATKTATKPKNLKLVAASAPALVPPSPPLPEMDEALILGPANWLGMDFYHADLLKARQVISRWYAEFWGMDEGGHVIISGGCGSGKTHFARCIQTLYQDGGARFVTEPELFAQVYGNKDSTIHKMRNAFPLIIDDIGTVGINKEKWVSEIYWQILNDNNHPLLVTTNLSLDELCTWIGERATSRLLDRSRFNKLNYVDLSKVPDYRLTETKAA